VKAFIRDRENPSIESITPLIPAAEWIEREIHDILGIEIKNHPNMRRLILADDWPEGVYPLRKDFKR
jgi:Ni,Fe-hydrogenase III component G